MSARRPRPLVVAGVVVVVVAVAATALGLTWSGDEPTAAPSRPVATEAVTRQSLTSTFTADGKVSYGESVPLGTPGSGIVTWLPAPGVTVDRGQQVFRVDDKPTVLLFGDLPFYRELAVDIEGPDVRQLEENLAALGYGGFTVDSTFTAATATAVKAWQKGLGREQTGTVGTDQVLIAPGAVRIAEQKVRLGAPASAEMLSVTGISRTVTAKVDIDDAHRVVLGGIVTVVLPDGGRTDAEITAVDQPVTTEDTSGMSGTTKTSVTFTVQVVDPAALGDLTDADVDVELSTEARTDVLTVPVAALLALAEGGYGVEVADGAATPRLVPVTTGMFSSGRVEVTGDLTEGDLVVVPS